MIKKMKKDEIRAFKISGSAINELFWELLNKNGEMLFDLPSDSESVFSFSWDKQNDELIFYAIEIEYPGSVDFKAIKKHIDNFYGITTDSVFKKNSYVSFSLKDVTLGE